LAPFVFSTATTFGESELLGYTASLVQDVLLELLAAVSSAISIAFGGSHLLVHTAALVEEVQAE
jgi:hypothetical protein